MWETLRKMDSARPGCLEALFSWEQSWDRGVWAKSGFPAAGTLRKSFPVAFARCFSM